ncbi:MAG: DPP IV N-terminal domain-containing protein [Gammaproteobacteria bacterium]|nr:DPP IV N-terminal domain-containing protein [Gammaproteobacteria bacterium]
MIRANNASTLLIRRAGCFKPVIAAILPSLVSCSAADVGPFAKLTDPSGCVIEQITTADYDEYQVQGASTDGKLLAMTASLEGAAENDTVYQVYEMDLGTGEKTNLSHILKNSGPFSPDNRFMVVAQASDNGKTDIYEYERATGELREVAPHANWDWLPSYSPDGRNIVFNSYREGGQSDVHLFEKATGTLTRITEHPGYDAHSQFSPDGKRILYHRQQGTRENGGYIFDLFVRDLDSGETTQLTDGEFEESYAAWAPDGRHIVYSSDAGGEHGKHNLYVLDTGDKASIRLTNGDWKDSYAFWSQDGKFIYFNSDRAGATNIYRMLMDAAECVGTG